MKLYPLNNLKSILAAKILPGLEESSFRLYYHSGREWLQIPLDVPVKNIPIFK